MGLRYFQLWNAVEANRYCSRDMGIGWFGLGRNHLRLAR